MVNISSVSAWQISTFYSYCMLVDSLFFISSHEGDINANHKLIKSQVKILSTPVLMIHGSRGLETTVSVQSVYSQCTVSVQSVYSQCNYTVKSKHNGNLIQQQRPESRTFDVFRALINSQALEASICFTMQHNSLNDSNN